MVLQHALYIHRFYFQVMTSREELLKGLTEEQISKVRSCESTEEIVQLAKSDGVELTIVELAAVAGGACEPGP